jgi:hypothetical protein
LEVTEARVLLAKICLL